MKDKFDVAEYIPLCLRCFVRLKPEEYDHVMCRECAAKEMFGELGEGPLGRPERSRTPQTTSARNEDDFRQRCMLRSMDHIVTPQQALEALSAITGNPRRDSEDARAFNDAVSTLENFIYIQSETASKARVYRAAIDQLTESTAAGAWQDGPAPKDGSWILGLFHGLPYVVGYDSWEVGGETLPDGTVDPPDGHGCGWCLAGNDLHVMDEDEPEKWARIIHPNRHMPALWDGPGDER